MNRPSNGADLGCSRGRGALRASLAVGRRERMQLTEAPLPQQQRMYVFWANKKRLSRQLTFYLYGMLSAEELGVAVLLPGREAAKGCGSWCRSRYGLSCPKVSYNAVQSSTHVRVRMCNSRFDNGTQPVPVAGSGRLAQLKKNKGEGGEWERESTAA